MCKSVKIWGVFFSIDEKQRNDLKFGHTLKSIITRNRSMCVKTFAIPKLLFRASVIALPNELVKEANSIIYTFIWNSKDKVKRYALISDIEKGGLDNVARVKSLGTLSLNVI